MDWRPLAQESENVLKASSEGRAGAFSPPLTLGGDACTLHFFLFVSSRKSTHYFVTMCMYVMSCISMFSCALVDNLQDYTAIATHERTTWRQFFHSKVL